MGLVKLRDKNCRQLLALVEPIVRTASIRLHPAEGSVREELPPRRERAAIAAIRGCAVDAQTRMIR